MKSIRRLFEKISIENPLLGSVVVFKRIVREKNFSHSRIAKMFNLLVNKEEYEESEKKKILKDLYRSNIPLNRTKNGGISRIREEKKKKMNIDNIDVYKPLLDEKKL